MNHGKGIAIFYIDQENGFFYGGTQMLTLAFPRDILADQDILNKEKFYILIKSFIETNKLEPSQVIIIFAPGLCYEKSYDGAIALTEKDNQEIKDFADLVPFEDVLSKVYKFGKKTSVICVNRDLVSSSKVALEKLKFQVVAAVPYIVLQIVIPELSENIDFDIMLSRFDMLKQYNMIEVVAIPAVGKAQGATKPKKNPRVYLLSGVFAVLGIILIIMIITNYILPSSSSQKKILSTPNKTSSPTPQQASQVSSGEEKKLLPNESSTPSAR